MPYGYIYKIKFPNGKHYIGLTTTSLKQRQNEHKKTAKYGDTKYLYNALRKYKMEDTLELIEIDIADTLEELCEKEIEYIIEYNSYYMNKNGYNMTHGGEGTNGYIHTEEDNKKHSEKMKKYYENPEAIQKCSEVQKKRFENPEVRKQMSEKIKKYFENPEAIQKNSEKIKKYFENPEARQKNSEAKKKYYENPEARQKNSEAKKKYYENPEAIKKNSEAQKKYNKDNPDARKKSLDTMGQNKPFDIFKNGTFIKTFNYQFEAKEYLQNEYHIITTIDISAVLRGTQKSSAGFQFKYKSIS